MPSRNKSKEVLESLKDRFLDGEKLSVDEIVDEYFDPKSPYNYLVLQKRVRGWLQSTKRWMRNENGLWFGNLNKEGSYGIVTTEEEARFAMIRYYRFVKGVVNNAGRLAKEAQKKGLLKGFKSERMLVAKIEEEEDESSDK